MIEKKSVTNNNLFSSWLTKLIKISALFSFVILSSCSPDDSTLSSSEKDSEPQTKWESVQTILSSRCISCHRSGRRHASISGLILTEDIAYASLVNALPKNSKALSDGKKRVSTSGNSEDRLSNSFLWTKINTISNSAYGSKMPTRGSLSFSDIAIIKSWIESGALEN
ncbi:hypothetical protein HOH45_05635 [bacterium]|jgi:hypothetical protein|nr:hypothetical protein [bacterium]